MVKKQRSDADRRVRQCERLGRLLRVLHLIMGKGGWDANTLAAELECSKRTIYRLLQSLSLAGVPWYFDESCRAYRVRPGFKFPFVEQAARTPGPRTDNLEALQPLIEKLISDGKAFACSLQQVLDSLQNL